MPFEMQKLSVLAYANGFTLWHYRSDTDTRGQSLSAGYFDSSAHLLRRGDMVLSRTSDAFSILHVASNTGSSVGIGIVA